MGWRRKHSGHAQLTVVTVGNTGRRCSHKVNKTGQVRLKGGLKHCSVWPLAKPESQRFGVMEVFLSTIKKIKKSSQILHYKDISLHVFLKGEECSSPDILTKMQSDRLTVFKWSAWKSIKNRRVKTKTKGLCRIAQPEPSHKSAAVHTLTHTHTFMTVNTL